MKGAKILNQLTFLRRIVAISEAGLAYANDRFDQERYQELHQLAIDQLSSLSDTPVSKIQQLFANESGYPTPKVDVRAFIKHDDSVLLVEDRSGRWALPGGFAEIGWTPSENVAKEVDEETGLKVNVEALRAIYDTSLRSDIPQFTQYYKLIFKCRILDGHFQKNSETVTMDWFSLDNLPPLSLKRTTKEQLYQLFNGSIHVD